MRISISKSKSPEARNHQFYREVEIQGTRHFCHLLTTERWSPIIWTNGVRKKANFKSCGYLGLDFDDGTWTLETASEWLKDEGYLGILGTTKSHQKPKRTPAGEDIPPCDRFRLVVPFAWAITDCRLYEFNMSRLMETIPCDPAAKDGGRFFHPCAEVVTITSGRKFEPAPFPPGYLEELKEKEEATTSRLQSLSEAQMVPGWLITLYTSDRPLEGDRNNTCFRLGADLGRCGWTLEEAQSYALQIDRLTGIGAENVRDAVANGWHKSQSGQAGGGERRAQT